MGSKERMKLKHEVDAINEEIAELKDILAWYGSKVRMDLWVADPGDKENEVLVKMNWGGWRMGATVIVKGDSLTQVLLKAARKLKAHEESITNEQE